MAVRKDICSPALISFSSQNGIYPAHNSVNFGCPGTQDTWTHSSTSRWIFTPKTNTNFLELLPTNSADMIHRFRKQVPWVRKCWGFLCSEDRCHWDCVTSDYFIHKAQSCLPIFLRWTFYLPRADWFQLHFLACMHNPACFSLSWTASAVLSIKAS